MPGNRRESVLLVAALVAVGILSAIKDMRTHPAPSVPSTFDSGRSGYAALFELLAREGVSVHRLMQPLPQLRNEKTLLVLAGNGALSAATREPGAAKDLDRWVRSGGAVLLADGSFGPGARVLGVPKTYAVKAAASAHAGCAFAARARTLRVSAPFTRAFRVRCSASVSTLLVHGKDAYGIVYRRGRGEVAAITGSQLFDNAHLARAQNARFAVAIFGAGRSVTFDEHIFGYTSAQGFWAALPPALHAAIWVAAAALLLLVLGENLPFAPPLPAGVAAQRDSSEYLVSIARLLQRNRTAHAILAQFEREAGALLDRHTGAREVGIGREWEELRALRNPSASQVLAAGRIFARIRKEY